MRVFLIAALCGTSSLVQAQLMDIDSIGKACVLAAAQRLPNISGLEIKGSRSQIAERKGKLDGRFNVEIDIFAANQNATFGFLCDASALGVIGVTPTGMLR